MEVVDATVMKRSAAKAGPVTNSNRNVPIRWRDMEVVFSKCAGLKIRKGRAYGGRIRFIEDYSGFRMPTRDARNKQAGSDYPTAVTGQARAPGLFRLRTHNQKITVAARQMVLLETRAAIMRSYGISP